MDNGAEDLESRSKTRTEKPSDLEHAFMLMQQNLKNDFKKPKLWFARLFLVGLMWMFYTIGTFTNYQRVGGGDEKYSNGETIFHPGLSLDTWDYPHRIVLSGAEDQKATLSKIEDNLVDIIPDILTIEERNFSNFQFSCNALLSGPKDICVFLNSSFSYGIYFTNENDFTSPLLASTQHSVNVALLNVSGVHRITDIDQVQRMPEIYFEIKKNSAPLSLTMSTSFLLVLAMMISQMFMVSPIAHETTQHIVDAFVLIGVKLRVYMLQWVAYHSLFGLLTAGFLTGISIGWNQYPMSSPFLVFLSHYFGLVQISAISVLLPFIFKNEELRSGVPFFTGLLSMGICAPVMILDAPGWILKALTVVFPFIGIIDYSSTYVKYDSFGFGTGVQLDSTAISSGILSSLLAQVAGMILWILVIILYSSAAVWERNKPKIYDQYSEDIDSSDQVEQLLESADVMLSIRGLVRSFSSGCLKKTAPLEVLRGLSMDICRGEVFGFLGHNGAGKTTTIRILSGELDLDGGSVSYKFSDGAYNIGECNMDLVRGKIGVCPQHNMLLRDLTCRETLHLFASLKGNISIKPGQNKHEAIESEVQRLISQLQFTSAGDVDKPVKTFSGGMMRKVSIAIALIGDPEVVFLDEPTAGMDPYNRRTVWDMIIEAKAGRSIILTTHFMDEADILSDRVGIIDHGRLVTCGSTLFLKNHFGAGYTLSYELYDPINIAPLVPGAKECLIDTPGSYQWDLPPGTECFFPGMIRKLDSVGAINVSLDFTSLETVFLETKKNKSSGDNFHAIEDEELSTQLDDINVNASENILERIWKPTGTITKLSFWQKLKTVQHFVMVNAFTTDGAVFVNIIMPFMYLVGGLVAVSYIDAPIEPSTIIFTPPIRISPYLLGDKPSQFFGISEPPRNFTISPLIPVNEPQNISNLFASDLYTSCGFWKSNNTLQFNETFSRFAMQMGLQTLANYDLLNSEYVSDQMTSTGILTELVQLPYETDEISFRVDIIILPMILSFGAVGMVFTVLDVLILKSNNIFNLFRVSGINDWMSYLGIMYYKSMTTFIPFMILLFAIGVPLESVILGNSGRWLGTVILLLAYAFSVTPVGLLLANLFLTDYTSAKNWFPGVYMTFVSLPYTTWVIFLQVFPKYRHTILAIGDVLCLIPPIAFQRGVGMLIGVSSKFNDPDLRWSTVWAWENRVWFTVLMMIVAGCAEWYYLRKLTLKRPNKTKLKIEEESAKPLDVSGDADVDEERERSLVDHEGINVQDLVKTFHVKVKDNDSGENSKILKKAVSGVSFGIRKNEIFALLGPNGAGKTVTMGCLTGEYTPEHGIISLGGERASHENTRISHLYDSCQVSYCPQFDSLFPKQTVLEHVKFYSKIRGLDINEESTTNHLNSILKLLGLKEHETKKSDNLSGGFKRRLSLAISMIGYPKCLLIDECTTGMSPDARRLVWDVLKPSIQSDSYEIPATLLSTHYMDEASKLGTRIGIMINGKLITTGSLGRLREKHCNSYFVDIQLKNSAPDSAEKNVLAAFESNSMPPAVYESLPFRFKIQVPFTNSSSLLQLADIFDLLESKKTIFYIKYYSVSLMNLEQIFINLSRAQFENDNK